MNLARQFLFCLCAALALSATVRAEVFYTFSNTDLVAGRNLQVNIDPNSTQTVPVYLAFTGSSATTLTSELGLRTADVQFVRTLSPSSPAGILDSSDVSPFSPFNVPAGSFLTYTSPADVDVFLDGQFTASSSNGVLGVAGPDSSILIPLTNVKFTAGTIALESTTFRARDFFQTGLPTSDDTITFRNLLVLDSQIGTADVTFTVNGAAVPLPTAAMMGLLLLLPLSARQIYQSFKCRSKGLR